MKAKKINWKIGRGEIETGSGLNQELSLTRARDTRWNSHFKTLSRLVEFVDRFSEVTSELLICMTGLNLHDSFCDFDPSKLRKLIDFYPHHFSYKDRMNILHELSVYPSHMQQDGRFATLKSISDLAKVMVETDTHLSFH
ncbi:uncharacterized protein LOC111907990 [Lactuca sativa]|uniref:uncharacterized protein LOC111907990 n=1 Tax=Lactuca sativa TaxID=4236 RepID=UPI000CD83433|nr:uncharacterized protein LOC111907990 [Lactuca sativa]